MGGGALTPPLGAWRVGAPGTLTPSFPAGALAPGWDGEGGESRGASARQALGRRRGRPRGPPLPEGPARSEGARARPCASFPPSLLVDPVDQLSPRSPRSRGGRSTSTPAVPRSRVDQHPVGAASPRRLPGRRRPGLSPSRGATSRPGLPPRPARFRQPHGAPVSPPLRGSTSKPFPRARLHSPCGGLEWFVPPPPVFHTQRFPRSRP